MKLIKRTQYSKRSEEHLANPQLQFVDNAVARGTCAPTAMDTVGRWHREGEGRTTPLRIHV
jgi:hypothetical protein